MMMASALWWLCDTGFGHDKTQRTKLTTSILIIQYEHDDDDTGNDSNMAAPYEVVDAMRACGVDNVTLFNGASAAQRIATEVFDDNHNSVMDKTY